MSALSIVTVSDIKSGDIFGQLRAIRGYLIGQSEYWLCLCNCGGADLVKAKQLRSSNRRSCGCVTNKRKGPV